MIERQTRGVEHLTRHAKARPSYAVRRIADDRMADRRAMDADLVRAPGFELQLQQCRFHIAGSEPLAHAVMRHGSTALRTNREPRADGSVTSDRRIDRPRSVRRHAPHDRIVAALHRPRRYR